MTCFASSAHQRHIKISFAMETLDDPCATVAARQVAFDQLGRFVADEQTAQTERKKKKPCSMLSEAEQMHRRFRDSFKLEKKTGMRGPLGITPRPQIPTEESHRPWAPGARSGLHPENLRSQGLTPAPRARRVRSVSHMPTVMIPQRTSSAQPVAFEAQSLGRQHAQATRNLEALSIEARFSLTDFLADHRFDAGNRGASGSLFSYDRPASTLMSHEHQLGSRPSTRMSFFFGSDEGAGANDATLTRSNSRMSPLNFETDTICFGTPRPQGPQRTHSFASAMLLDEPPSQL